MVRLLRPVPCFNHLTHLRFQSHNGAIAAVLKLPNPGEHILVSIPQWCDCCWFSEDKRALHLEFQSHNGAIAAGQSRTGWEKRRRFQSHNGAIAAVLNKLPEILKSMFQSHNGAIAAWQYRYRAWFGSSFNPTMVRLLPKRSNHLTPSRVFQSHNGAIAA